MKKRYVLFLVIAMCISLCACGNGAVENDVEVSVNVESTTESTTEMESDATNEVEERTWKTDALEEEIVELSRFFRKNVKYYSEDESVLEFNNTLEALIEKLSVLRNENLMADKFLTELETTDYYSLNDSDKFFFDVCIKLLMQEKSFEVTSISVDDLMHITGICYRTLENGDNSPENDRHFFLKFDERNTEGRVDGDVILTRNDYIWVFENDGSIQIGDAEIFDVDGRSSGITIDDVKYKLVLHVLDTQYYSDIISRNRDFFEFIVEYREDVYKTERNKELAEFGIKTNEHYEDKKDKEKKKNAEPKIGMTESEVKQGAWGYPNDINRDEYSWGVKEQWVYDDKGYVYFENGVVTAVQHR